MDDYNNNEPYEPYDNRQKGLGENTLNFITFVLLGLIAYLIQWVLLR